MTTERLEPTGVCPVRGQACACMVDSVVHRECLARAEAWLARANDGRVLARLEGRVAARL